MCFNIILIISEGFNVVGVIAVVVNGVIDIFIVCGGDVVDVVVFGVADVVGVIGIVGVGGGGGVVDVVVFGVDDVVGVICIEKKVFPGFTTTIFVMQNQ